ncbi:hypothetical protein [Microbacterium aurum]|nr:hypothetical protein [Microbacterium aurum]MBM7826053.1 hypothetical protein [Microbacterium aurum]
MIATSPAISAVGRPMVDGLRIQALLDPTRETLPLLETFMRLIATPEDS